MTHNPIEAQTRQEGVVTDNQWVCGAEDQHSERRERIRSDISLRLRRVCPDYSDDEFNRLLDAMTDEQLKGEERANRLWK